MSVYKDEKTGKWYALAWYHDWKGEGRQKCKRGFETKKEAQDWERSYVQQNTSGIDMTFEAFCGLYEKDRRPRLKESTWLTKENIIKNKLIPAFGKMMMSEIETKHIIAWQNELLAYRDEFKKPYSATYLKTVHNQLVAILNHAVRHYGLKSNPASKVGYIGSKEREEMNFWTKEEYMKFTEAIMDKPMSYYAFEMLYWCGLRLGELLALTAGDFDFENKMVRINKSCQRINGVDIITDPKTPKSIRKIQMPDFLVAEMQDYFATIYNLGSDDRIFPLNKSYMHNEMTRGSKNAGVKRIRIHDLRHSHVSLLINMGFGAVAIADRVGHESIDITYRYAHLFPTTQKEIAEKLELERS